MSSSLLCIQGWFRYQRNWCLMRQRTPSFLPHLLTSSLSLSFFLLLSLLFTPPRSPVPIIALDIKEIHQHNNYRATKCASGLAQLGCLHAQRHTFVHTCIYIDMSRCMSKHADTDAHTACASEPYSCCKDMKRHCWVFVRFFCPCLLWHPSLIKMYCCKINFAWCSKGITCRAAALLTRYNGSD